MSRQPTTCAVDGSVPFCGTGPAGRLSFVLREARAAWRRHRTRSSGPTNVTSTLDDSLDAPLRADGRPDLPLGGTR